MRNLVKYVGIGLLVMGLAACDDKDTNATAQGSVAESNATGNPVNLLDGKLSFSLPADMTDQSGKLGTQDNNMHVSFLGCSWQQDCFARLYGNFILLIINNTARTLHEKVKGELKRWEINIQWEKLFDSVRNWQIVHSLWTNWILSFSHQT